MRHGTQERRLDEIAPAERLRLERLLHEATAVERHGEQRSEGRKETVPHADVGIGVSRHVEGSDAAAVDLERDGRIDATAMPRPELHLCARDAEHAGRLRSHPAELRLERLATEQAPRDLREQRRLTLTLLRLGGAATRPRRELADDERRNGIDSQGEPVRRLLQRERMGRRQEEEVEREHARDRDRKRPADPPRHGDWQHGEHVEHAEGKRRREGLERPDEQRGHCHRRDRSRKLDGHGETVPRRPGGPGLRAHRRSTRGSRRSAE